MQQSGCSEIGQHRPASSAPSFRGPESGRVPRAAPSTPVSAVSTVAASRGSDPATSIAAPPASLRPPSAAAPADAASVTDASSGSGSVCSTKTSSPAHAASEPSHSSSQPSAANNASMLAARRVRCSRSVAQCRERRVPVIRSTLAAVRLHCQRSGRFVRASVSPSNHCYCALSHGFRSGSSTARHRPATPGAGIGFTGRQELDPTQQHSDGVEKNDATPAWIDSPYRAAHRSLVGAGAVTRPPRPRAVMR